jgi:hypothetical protein
MLQTRPEMDVIIIMIIILLEKVMASCVTGGYLR